jgi:hypothetical protein
MWKSFILGALLLGTLAAGPPAAAPSKKPPAQKCVPDGRYWFHLDKGQKVFCFDGDGYSEEAAPPHVKTFFETNGASDGGVSDGPIANPTMVDPSLPIPSPSGGGTNGGPLAVGPISGSGGAGGGGGGGRSQIRDWSQVLGGSRSASTAPMSPRDPDPVNPDLFESIQKGMSRLEVTAKLGRAHGRIMNSGDEGVQEIWTYMARGATTGSVRFLDGKVIAIRKP